MSNEEKSLRKELLDDAAKKPIRKFIQYDVFFNAVSDSMVHPDEDGDAISSGPTYELKLIPELRILVPSGADPGDVIRGLQKVIKIIEDNPGDIIQDWGYDEQPWDPTNYGRHYGWHVIEPERGKKYGNFSIFKPDDDSSDRLDLEDIPF